MTLKGICVALVVASALVFVAPATGQTETPGPFPRCTPGPPFECDVWRNTNVQLAWAPPPGVTAQSPPGCLNASTVTAEGTTVRICGVTVTGYMDPGWGTARVLIDKTAPTVTGATPNRPSDGGGWYRSPVQLGFSGTDALSGVASCTAPTYAGPDSANASVAGTCTDVAGNTSAPSGFAVKYDSTGPVVNTGRAVRKPDRRGWYIRPVRWRFTGSDGLSGVAACPSVRYAGPDGGPAQVVGACRDNAGNVTFRGFPIRYDDTPPARPLVRALSRDRAVRLNIRVGPDVRRIRVNRTPGGTVYRGRVRDIKDQNLTNYKRYRYSVIAIDRAGHRSRRRTISAVPKPMLLSPPNGAVLTSPPLLRWSKVGRADYYNVQLERDGVKVLSAWPSRARLQLKRRWEYHNRVRRLRPGNYEWNVWPGYGPRGRANYGARIGKRTFVIPAAPPG
jgi:hypothetical protein